ncbi:MAG: N-acetylneuraminate synthase family protein [Rhodobacteraceae bacterium]|nr:N-acetylneuraminate synthase family protein [Paracoccaceae bacterium]
MALTVEGKTIGRDARSFLIAEVSANHDRDLDQALALVDIAADAGWDALKLQTYSADTLTMRSDHPSMTIDKVWGTTNLYDLYQTAGMPMEFHEPLFAKARARGLLPFTSVYDPMDLDFIESLDCPIYKIASFEMTFDDLLIAVAGTKKPIILSTGMATMDEIAHALEVLDTANSGEVILLHCCSSYPAPLDQINLNAMVAIGDTFGRMTGFSDHTIGSIGPITAAAMGAVAIEKHYTNDPNRKGPDHRFSATPEIMRDIANGVRDVHALQGSAVKQTTDAEVTNKKTGRRSAFAQIDLAAGHRITPADYRFIRPGVGIPPTDRAALDGRVLKQNVPMGHPITYGDLE